MINIKLITGITIIVICMLILMFELCAHFLHWKRPAFLVDCIVEISILLCVSFVMGLLLIFL